LGLSNKFIAHRVKIIRDFYTQYIFIVGGFMTRILLFLLVFATSSGVAVQAQTPDAPETAPRAFAWSFDGDGSYLGVQTQEVNKENFAKLGLREVRGVAVEKVLENSPALAAGIQPGDVIVRFNGEEVTGSRKLTRLVSEVAPDHQAKVAVLRGGSERELNVTVGKRPAPKFEGGNFEFRTPMPMGEMPKLPPIPNAPGFSITPRGDGNVFVFRSNSRQMGVSLTPLGKQLGDYFGVSDGTGLLVNSVRENSPAAKAGLKAGDVIVAVDGNAVKGNFDIVKAINDKKEGDVELTIVRDKSKQTVRVTPEVVKDDGEPFFQRFENGDLNGITLRGKGLLSPGAITLAMPGRIL
jgi:serine protease Do